MSEEGFAPLASESSPEADASGGDGGSVGSPLEALLETEPSLDAGEEAESLGVGLAGGHAYVGIRKFINGLLGVDPGVGGMPAVGNFAFAGYHYVSEGAEEASAGDAGAWESDSPDGSLDGTERPAERSDGGV